jgi:hypothetical protein
MQAITVLLLELAQGTSRLSEDSSKISTGVEKLTRNTIISRGSWSLDPGLMRLCRQKAPIRPLSRIMSLKCTSVLDFKTFPTLHTLPCPLATNTTPRSMTVSTTQTIWSILLVTLTAASSSASHNIHCSTATNLPRSSIKT